MHKNLYTCLQTLNVPTKITCKSDFLEYLTKLDDEQKYNLIETLVDDAYRLGLASTDDECDDD